MSGHDTPAATSGCPPDPVFRRRRRPGQHEDGIAGADAARQQREGQRIGAAGARDRVPDADMAGDRLLERPDLRPEDELAMRDHARDRRLNAPGQVLALGGEIDERQL